MISNKTIEAALSQLQERHQALGDELRQKAIEHAGLQIAIDIVDRLLTSDATAATAEVVPPKPKRIAQHNPPQKPQRRGRGPANPDRDAEIVKRLKDGATVEELAEEFNLSRATIYNIRNRAQSGPSKAKLIPQESLTGVNAGPLTPQEREMLRNRIEGLVRAAKRLTTEQICNGCHITEKQFNEIAKLASIEEVDGKWQCKLRF